jgi:hypothetical protein
MNAYGIWPEKKDGHWWDFVVKYYYNFSLKRSHTIIACYFFRRGGLIRGGAIILVKSKRGDYCISQI